MRLVSYSAFDFKQAHEILVYVDFKKLDPTAHVIKHPAQDIAIVMLATVDENVGSKPVDASGGQGKLETYRFNFLPGITSLSNPDASLMSAKFDNLPAYDDVLVGNEVYVFGYPTSVTLLSQAIQLDPSEQLDPKRPLLRRGVIAGLNPGGRSIVIESTSYWGNSGGAVLEVDTDFLQKSFSIIGIVHSFVPYAEGGLTYSVRLNTGYSIVTPIDSLFDILPDPRPTPTRTLTPNVTRTPTPSR